MAMGWRFLIGATGMARTYPDLSISPAVPTVLCRRKPLVPRPKSAPPLMLNSAYPESAAHNRAYGAEKSGRSAS